MMTPTYGGANLTVREAARGQYSLPEITVTNTPTEVNLYNRRTDVGMERTDGPIETSKRFDRDRARIGERRPTSERGNGAEWLSMMKVPFKSPYITFQ